MPRHATEPYVQKHAANWQPMITIFDMAVAIPATPSAVLIDEEVNVAVYGLTSTTYRHGNVTIMFEKPDGSGGWLPTNYNTVDGFYNYLDGLNYPPAGIPTNDAEGYEVALQIVPGPMKLPKHASALVLNPDDYGPSRGQVTGEDWNARRGSRPGMEYSPQPEDRVARVRLRARRSTRVYDAGEQATIDALGYRVRIVLKVPNLVLWEKEIAIPTAASSDIFLNEEIDLTDYGLISDHERFKFSAEVRRNGKTIRCYLPDEYTIGEEFDPPCQNIAIAFRPTVPGTPWWNDQNSQQMGVPITSGWLFNSTIANCSESSRQILRVLAWRWGTDRTDYYDGTLSTAEHDLSTVDASMQGTLWGRYGWQPDPYWGPTTMPVIVRFTPQADAAGTSAVATATGVQIIFIPGTTTLQDVFDAIDGMNAGPNGDYNDRTCMVYTGTLTAPAYVFNQSAEFTTTFDIPSPTPVSIPAGSFDNCTLVVRLLTPPPNRMWEYPFQCDGDSGIAETRLRVIPKTVLYPPREGSLWNAEGTLRFGPQDVPTDVTFKSSTSALLLAPPMFGGGYETTYNGDGTLSAEIWTDDFWPTPRVRRRVDYTYVDGLISTEVTRVYSELAAIVAQTTVTYTYSAGQLISHAIVRDV